MAIRRSTRERKVIPIDESLLQDDEAYNDYWGQDGLPEDAEDGEFDSGDVMDEGEDEVDSDFDAPEAPAEDDSGENAEKVARAEERAETRKVRSTGYVDPAKRAKRKQPATAASTAEPAKRPRTSSVGGSTTPATSTPVPRRSTGLRNSTKRASLKAAEIRALREKEEAVRRKKRSEQLAARKPVKILTQEEKLIEAIETEKLNKESLKDLLRLEEEQKRVPVRKSKKASQCISFRHRGGISTLSFVKASANVDKILFPQQARAKAKESGGRNFEDKDAAMADVDVEVTNEEATAAEVRAEEKSKDESSAAEKGISHVKNKEKGGII